MTLSARLTDPNSDSVVVRRTGLHINGQPEIVVEIEARPSHDYIAIQGTEQTVIETFRQAWNMLVNLPDRGHEIVDSESQAINDEAALSDERRAEIAKGLF